MHIGLCLHASAPLPADTTPHANKHWKLHIRKLDATALWYSRKWPFHAQIRGFAKVNTWSNMEGDLLKIPPGEHTPWASSTQAGGDRFGDICSWLE